MVPVELEGLIRQPPERRSGSISWPEFREAWLQSGSEWAIQVVTEGARLPWKGGRAPPMQEVWVPRARQHRSPEDLAKSREEVRTQAARGTIEPQPPDEPHLLCPFFTVPKRDPGERRSVFDGRGPNEFMERQFLRMETLAWALKLLFPRAFLASVDVGDAFHSVPLHPDDRPYMAFCIREEDGTTSTWRYCTLPMGASPSPAYFARMLKVALRDIRAEGIVLVIYCDDILIIAPSRELALAWTRRVIEELQRHGFWVKLSKSALVPAHQCLFLGFVIDTASMTVHLPLQKQKDARKLVRRWLSRRIISGRDLARLVGILMSLSPAVLYGRAHTRALEALLKPVSRRCRYSARVQLTQAARDDLQWWLKTLKARVARPIMVNTIPDLEVELDASSLGRGAHIPRIGLYIRKPYHGTVGKCLTSNFRELSGVSMVLEELENKVGFHQLLPGRRSRMPLHLRFHLDNTTAEAYINNEGGRWPALNRLALEAWSRAERAGVIISASYLKGEFQWMADPTSRLRAQRHDYQLIPDVREKIFARMGRPTLDLFATAESAVVERFVSWMPHPKATFVDAMSLKWGSLQGLLYAFPPIGMVTSVLMKLIRDRVEELVLITPAWEAAPWWPLLTRVTLDRMTLPPAINCLTSAGSEGTQEPSVRSSMIASRCSWRGCEREADLWSRLLGF